jgi:uncharacterized protein with von Willebrand factor type A (vWA) domain
MLFLKERNKELESRSALIDQGTDSPALMSGSKPSSIRIGESSHPAGRAVFPDETFQASGRRTP